MEQLHPCEAARVAVYGASSPRTHQVIAALRGRCSTELREPDALLGKAPGTHAYVEAECIVLVLDSHSDRRGIERALGRMGSAEGIPVIAVSSSGADDAVPWPALRTEWLPSTASSIEVRQVVERVVRLAPLRRVGHAIAAARHLPPLLRRALHLVCADPRGVGSVQALGDRLHCSRSTLWHHWRPLWGDGDPPRLQDFVDWVLLYRASVAVSPTRSWATAAERGAGVHEDTLARMARRLLGWRLRELGRDGADVIVLEKFNHEMLRPLLERDSTLRLIMRRSAVEPALGDVHHTPATRTASAAQAPMAS